MKNDTSFPLGYAGWGCAIEILARKTPHKRRERGGYQLPAKTKKTQQAQNLGQIGALERRYREQRRK